jgi:phenylacetate-coenzyme A ligase PaaK-like adenylate-forming protein
MDFSPHPSWYRTDFEPNLGNQPCLAAGPVNFEGCYPLSNREGDVSTAIELLRQGRKSQIWTKYCGFLDLSIDEFMQIQERLLSEQINLISKTDYGKRFFGERPPRSAAEFRHEIPITDYENYEQFFEEKRGSGKFEGAYLWAHTSGRSGPMKWIPYTHEAYLRLGERVLSGIILAAAREKGEVRLEEGDTLVYNTPPRPYISGIILRALGEQFNFHFIPPLDETEEMDFQERIEKGFETGLETGIDVLGSISVVLVKMGERFAAGAQTMKLRRNLLKPQVAFRLARGLLRSKLEGRPMLPRDLWTLKALTSGGMDTSIYRDKIAYYWGVVPYDQYGSTEDGSIAAQAWNKKWMTFFPDAAFVEFIPEEEWAPWSKDPAYHPKTVLLNEVVTEKNYELVITNYYGMPLLRYRTHDVVQFAALADKEIGVNLPQMTFVARTGDFIDLAGFTGIIDEKMVWQAIVGSGVDYTDWALRKETQHGEPILHLYIETSQPIDSQIVQQKVHESMKSLNPYYADYEHLLEKQALDVTILPKGTFQAYMLEKQAAGTDLAHLKPPHMNASDDVIQILLNFGKQDA